MNEIEKSESIIAKALRAMFNQPGSKEDVESRKSYIEMKRNPKNKKLKNQTYKNKTC